MGESKQKLELTWVGKENRPKLEPRILVEDPAKSYHAAHRVSENDIFDNILIYGDNLLALKALEQEFTGKIKCIYIDPPFNTGSAFEHYNDGVEHSLWLSLMRDRLCLLHTLLCDDGLFFAQIDDNEQAHMRILLDEIFGRKNFVATLLWQKKYAPKSDSKLFSESHDYILCFAKTKDLALINRLPKTEKQTSRYKNRDDDPRGHWKAENILRNEARDYAIFPVIGPNGIEHWPPKGASWRYTKEKMLELIADQRIWFGARGTSRPSEKRFLTEVTSTVAPTTWWSYDEVGHNDEAKRELRRLFPHEENLFQTPKPERLIQRILYTATNPGDIILDSFAGSGTTGAVAHKMGRRWIMVELGEHCHTHCIPRMKKVIDGEDSGGITKAVNWKGGGGFRYYRLAPSLIVNDEWGNPVINSDFNPAMLAEAICKLEGFTYAPSDEMYWMHGKSTETDFIYVTTQTLTRNQLQRLSDEVGEKRSLLVMCCAFRIRNLDDFPNLTVKKIPKAVLKKCEWGHDDYSLEIKNLPQALPEPDEAPEDIPAKPRRKFGKEKTPTPSLFDMGGGR